MYKEIRKILSSSCLSEDNNGCEYDGCCYEHENAKIEELIAKHDSELLDKVADRIKEELSEYDFWWHQEFSNGGYVGDSTHDDLIDKVIAEMKAEVRE